MVRVLQVYPQMNNAGTERVIFNLYENIDTEKVQFDFLVERPGELDEKIRRMGGKIYYLQADKKQDYYQALVVLLFNFVDEKHLCRKGRITIDIFNKEHVISFLEWLETSRNASVSTRNQRLAALKSFCKYASANAIEYLDIFQQILDIKPKKSVSKTVEYLSVDGWSFFFNTAKN